VNAVFADTFFYLAVLRKDDPARPKASAEAKINRHIITTEFILLELGNACAHVGDREDFLSLVAGLRASPRVEIVPLNQQLLKRGWICSPNAETRTGRSPIAFRSRSCRISTFTQR